MYHVQESEDVPWKTGPEMQVLDNTKHRDGKNPLTSAGSCYALYAPSKDVTRPVGEWNQAKLVVTARGRALAQRREDRQLREGQRRLERQGGGEQVQGVRQLRQGHEGFIDLQDHGDHVEYRSIKLRVLKPVKTASN
jgi:hypothetical protein